MKLTRSYYNSASELLRVDIIGMERRTDRMIDGAYYTPTFARRVITQLRHVAADRVVDLIELEGDYEAAGVAPDYAYVTWTLDGNTVRCNMSDLPVTTDTV